MAETMSPGVIDPRCAYTVQELARRLGVRKDTVYSWRACGLTIHGKAGGKVEIVLGADFIEWYTSKSASGPADFR